MFSFDSDKLCRMVETRPAIWDKTMEGVYRNPRHKRPAWMEIYEEIVPRWNVMEEQQRQDAGRFLTAKWTQIRDVWHKKLKRRKELNEPEPAEGSKEWHNYNRLRFLEKVYEVTPQRDNNPNPERLVDPEADTVPNFAIFTEDASDNRIASANPTPESSSPGKKRKQLAQSQENTPHKVKKTEQVSLENSVVQGVTGPIETIKIDPDTFNDYDVQSDEDPDVIDIDEDEDPFVDTSISFTDVKPDIGSSKSMCSIKTKEEQEPTSSYVTNAEDPESNDRYLFLRSIFNTVQNFNKVQYLDFQMGVLKTVREIITNKQ